MWTECAENGEIITWEHFDSYACVIYCIRKVLEMLYYPFWNILNFFLLLYVNSEATFKKTLKFFYSPNNTVWLTDYKWILHRIFKTC